MPVKINRADEKFYRRAAERVTDTVNEYIKRVQGRRSEKEVLLMALVDIALKYEMETQRNDTEPFADIMVKLTGEMKSMLNNDNS